MQQENLKTLFHFGFFNLKNDLWITKLVPALNLKHIQGSGPRCSALKETPFQTLHASSHLWEHVSPTMQHLGAPQYLPGLFIWKQDLLLAGFWNSFSKLRWNSVVCIGQSCSFAFQKLDFLFSPELTSWLQCELLSSHYCSCLMVVVNISSAQGSRFALLKLQFWMQNDFMFEICCFLPIKSWHKSNSHFEMQTHLQLSLHRSFLG